MLEKIKIPTALQIRVDDVAWHNGPDERFKGLPSRSGLPRMHHPSDYLVLNEIGKGLGAEINCPLVIGEWDKNNILRGVPHVTYNQHGWDRASEIDMDYALKCFEAMESSEYIDYSLHGLLHGYYDEDKQITECQYYPFEKVNGEYIKGKNVKLPLDEFRRHLDLFYEIYNAWGFKKKISSFSAPCGSKGTMAENSDYAEIINKEYGFFYWPNGWRDSAVVADVVEGVVCAKCRAVAPWDAYDINPDFLPLHNSPDMDIECDFGMHWTNFIRYNPECNMERVPNWISYFNRQTEVFGTMLSKNIRMGSSQLVYSKFSTITIEDGKYVIDLEKADNKKAVFYNNEFYVSFLNGTQPKEIQGGAIELYETKQDFKTYKITRQETDKIIIGC